MATGRVRQADRAEELVASPRGLAALSELCGEDPDVWTRRLPGPLAAPTMHPFDTRTPELRTASQHRAALDDSERLAVEVLLYGSGYAWWGERRLTADAVARRGPAFLDAARELLGAAGAQWWADDIVRDRQVVLGSPNEPPAIERRAEDQGRMIGPAMWGRIPQVLVTSRRLDDRLPAVQLCDQDALRPVNGRVGCWAVDVPPEARVREVHGIEDWRELLVRYPRRVATTDDLRCWGATTPEAVVPDWTAFRRDWDALHISMLGVLTAQSVPIGVDGADGVLEDVNADVTAWFRPLPAEPVLIATVAEDDLPDHLPWP